jgi:biopolymer transport protein ExbD
MKFPRNARIFRGQLDAAPFLAVFFLLVIFVMIGSMTFTPGVRIQLPVGERMSDADGPSLAVAVDAKGRYYFRNQMIDGAQLVERLRAAAANSGAPLTLIVQADRDTRRETLDELASIAKQAGIRDLLLATLPRP